MEEKMTVIPVLIGTNGIIPKGMVIRGQMETIETTALLGSVRIFIFTNPSARAGYDIRSIFKRSLTGLNSEFSFS